MISTIKEVCIFMMIAQAVLLLLPGTSYMKYVRVLVGILMILMISKPVFALFMGEEGAEALSVQLEELKVGLPKVTQDSDLQLEEGEDFMGIYSGIEEELKSRLNESTEEVYYVEAVELKQGNPVDAGKTGDGIEYIRLTVKERNAYKGQRIEIAPIMIGDENYGEKDKTGFSKEEEAALKSRYGERLGVDPERIEIVKSYG